MYGGPIVTRKFFRVDISSKSQLQFSLETLKEHFSNFEIQTPTIAGIEKACQDYANRDPQSKEKYLAVFGEPQAETRTTPKIEELQALPKEEKTDELKISLGIRKRTQHTKEKRKPLEPVSTEGLIGLGNKYGAINSSKKTETQKQILEIRETFANPERTCIFCGSTKLELLKVSSPDPKTSRSEYKCTDCKLVFAVRSPNL